jgi:cytochrome c oxidase subunit 4
MRQDFLRLGIVYLVLLALLAITVTASFLPLHGFSPVVAIGIAAAKAALILWFYMHLRGESSLVRLTAVGGAAWLMILLLLSWADFGTRGWF